jgi:hypothetical protein
MADRLADYPPWAHGNNPHVCVVLLERFPMASRDAASQRITDDNRREKDFGI